MNAAEKKYFTSMLTDKFLVPNFVNPLSKYNYEKNSRKILVSKKYRTDTYTHIFL